MLRRFILLVVLSVFGPLAYAQGWLLGAEIDSVDGYSIYQSSSALDGDYYAYGNFLDQTGLDGQPVLTRAGAVMIYKRSSQGEWLFHQKVVAEERVAFSEFGYALCMQDSTLIITSRSLSYQIGGVGPIYQEQGKVFAFELNENGFWEQVQGIEPSIGQHESRFGYSLSLFGNELVIGAKGLSQPIGTGNGSVFVFKRNEQGVWIEEQLIMAGAEPDTDYFLYDGEFGFSVSHDSSVMVIGCPSTSTYNLATGDLIWWDVGSAFIYEKNEDGIWEFSQRLTESSPIEYGHFGCYVQCIEGSVFIKSVNGYGNDVNQVFEYREVEGVWEEEQEITYESWEIESGIGFKVREGMLCVESDFDEEHGLFFYEKVGDLDDDGDEDWGLVQSIDHVTFNKRGFDFNESTLIINGYQNNSEPGVFTSRLEVYEECLTQTTNLEVEVCDKYVAPSGWPYFESGNIVDSVSLNESCFDIYHIDLEVNLSTEAYTLETACEEFESYSGNYVWTETGTYLDTIANSVGCDSVLIVILVMQTDSVEVSEIACDSLTWGGNGETYYESGTYTAVFENAYGCDSTVSMGLFVDHSEYIESSVVACDSYYSPSGNYTWTQSGTYLDTTQNVNGCPEYHSIDLSVEYSPYDSISIEVCDEYLSPSGNEVWTKSGNYIDILPSSQNCDSLVYIDLQVLNSTYLEIDTSNCMGMYSPFNNEYWGESGDYEVVIANTQGCDSVITFDLNIPEPETNVLNLGDTLLFSTAYGASFIQWVDCENGFSIVEGETDQGFSPEESGSYAAVITEFGCTDTSACKTITITSTNEAENLAFTIYPNPGRGQFKITVSDYIENGALNLYDSQGRLVYSTPLKQTQEMRFEPRVENGTYILRLMRDKAVLGETRLIVMGR